MMFILDNASDFDHHSDIANKWLSAEERALAVKKAQEQAKLEEEMRKRRIISLDLTGKKVTAVSQEEARAAIEADWKAQQEAGTNVPTNMAREVEEFDKENKDLNEPVEDGGSTGLFRNPTLAVAPRFISVDLKKMEEILQSRKQGMGNKLTLKMKKEMALEAKRLQEEEEAKKAELEKLKEEVGGDSKMRRAVRRAETKPGSSTGGKM
jgi:hypothetical protein